jgi:Tol biopolymer transport system component
VSAISWLPDGGGLLVAAVDSTVSDSSQLWFVQYPTGTAHRITNDLAGYARLSLTADGRMLVAARTEFRGTLWVGPAGKPDQAVQVPGIPNTLASIPIRWTADGRILYTASVGGNLDVYSARPDGTEVRQLTTSPGRGFNPTAAPDNRHVVFLSNRDDKIRVWRMDADGSRQTALTPGPFDIFPVVSGDSTAVYYVRGDQMSGPIYRVPIGGGEPAPLLSTTTQGEADNMPPSFHPYFLSPDGSLLLGLYWDLKEGRQRLAIVDPGSRRAARRLDVPVALGLTQSFAWAPGGRAITFARVSDGTTNLWRLPVDGGAPSRVTNFKGGDTIAVHAWSPDGKLLAMVRVATTRDVVVIRDVRR